MADEAKKKILIVDDSELDREILKIILEEICDIEEADDAFAALEHVTSPDSDIDAILLDVQMPGLDGFGFIRIAKLLHINIPIVLITAEATRENVAKAAQSGVISFLSKPFHRETVQERMNSILKKIESDGAAKGAAGGGAEAGAEAIGGMSVEDLVKTLEDIIKNYLKARKKNDKKYKHTEAIAEILLQEAVRTGKVGDLTDEDVLYISKAAYFCDLGLMFLPDEQAFAVDPLKVGGWQEKMVYKAHTTLGAQMVGLAAGGACQKFVEICEDICQNHHERIDGKGYPRGIHESDFSFNAQVCGMAYDLADLAERTIDAGGTVEDAIKQFETTTGNYGFILFDILATCHNKIVAAFR